MTVLYGGRSAIGEITSKVLAKEENEARSIDWWGHDNWHEGRKVEGKDHYWRSWLCFIVSI